VASECLSHDVDYREVGLEPTGDTYTVLMCDLAEKGDISGIEKVGDSVGLFLRYLHLHI